MKKSIIIGIIVAVVISVGILSALKTTLGDEATELPGEESMEKTLNLQEENEKEVEFGENEADELAEYGER